MDVGVFGAELEKHGAVDEIQPTLKISIGNTGPSYARERPSHGSYAQLHTVLNIHYFAGFPQDVRIGSPRVIEQQFHYR